MIPHKATNVDLHSAKSTESVWATPLIAISQMNYRSFGGSYFRSSLRRGGDKRLSFPILHPRQCPRHPLLRGEITYSKARKEEVNILRRLEYHNRQHDFFASLSNNRDWIKDVITHHLGLPSTVLCQVADVEDWLHGSFNVCVPVSIKDWKARKQPGTRVLLRLPLPYRVGEEYCPGNSDEKIRCEAGTYVWLQENCPDIPIPRLYGFATSDGETVWFLFSP